MANTEENAILIGSYENHLYLIAVGHITANLCFPIRTHLYKKIIPNSQSFQLYIDLSQVTYMDSTFMGLLVGIEQKISQCFNQHLHIINACSDAKKFLKSMNLDGFLQLEDCTVSSDITFVNFDKDVDISETEKSQIVLTTHENLSALSEKNKKKFFLLEKMLRERIEKFKKR